MTPKENLLAVIFRQKPEWVPNGLENIVTIRHPVVERPPAEGLDCFGVHWSFDAGAEGGTYPAHGQPVITDLRRWRDQVKFPNVEELDWSEAAKQARAVNRREFLVQGFVEMGLFERSYLLLGMEEALMAYLEAPDLMNELAGAIADYKIRLISRLDDAADLDMIWYGDDWGTQQNLFLPEWVWRQIIRPHTRRIYDCMKSRDIIINQHSCGKIESIFPDIVEMGMDIWNPCQPCNDLANLKRVYGDRVAFCGGIDSQFVLDRPGVTPAEVRAEVRKRIDEMAKGGGYIAAPSHGVPYRPEIIEAMKDEIQVYGRAFYSDKDDI